MSIASQFHLCLKLCFGQLYHRTLCQCLSWIRMIFTFLSIYKLLVNYHKQLWFCNVLIIYVRLFKVNYFYHDNIFVAFLSSFCKTFSHFTWVLRGDPFDYLCLFPFCIFPVVPYSNCAFFLSTPSSVHLSESFSVPYIEHLLSKIDF